jgi:hypothetical protein
MSNLILEKYNWPLINMRLDLKNSIMMLVWYYFEDNFTSRRFFCWYYQILFKVCKMHITVLVILANEVCIHQFINKAFIIIFNCILGRPALNPGEIVGVCIGALVFLAIVIFLIYLCTCNIQNYRKRHSNHTNTQIKESLKSETNNNR